MRHLVGVEGDDEPVQRLVPDVEWLDAKAVQFGQRSLERGVILDLHDEPRNGIRGQDLGRSSELFEARLLHRVDGLRRRHVETDRRRPCVVENVRFG